MKRFLIAATLMLASAASAQSPNDPSARLRKALPAKVADHVLATIADARSHSLPAKALENQALRLANKGTKPEDIEKSVDKSAENMKKGKDALEKSGRKPKSGEIVAAGALMGRGVDGAQVTTWAKAASVSARVPIPRSRPFGIRDPV